jgi:hypothetical protein|tara:strand:- start:161 stop:295 length:135 start_codon:yes stop_codon:yes gene_type:complete
MVNAERGLESINNNVAQSTSTRTIGCLILSKKAFLAIVKVCVNI